MRKLVIITVMFMIFSLVFPAANTSAKTIFRDVPNNFWAKDAIHDFYNNGYMNGYEDGSFGVNQLLTRPHAAVIFSNVLGLDTSNGHRVSNYFKDIKPSHTYAGEIAAVAEAGIFNGSDGKFLPDLLLTREQMATTLVNALNLKSSGKKVRINLSNVGTSHKQNVQILADLGITNQLDDFRPKEHITRAQFVVFFKNALEHYDGRLPIPKPKPDPGDDDPGSGDDHVDKTAADIMKHAVAKEAEVKSFRFENHLELELKSPRIFIPDVGLNKPQATPTIQEDEKVRVEIAGTYQKNPLLVSATVKMIRDGQVKNTTTQHIVMTKEKIWIKYPDYNLQPILLKDGKANYVAIDIKELEEQNKAKHLDMDYHTGLALLLHELIAKNIGMNDYKRIASTLDIPSNVDARDVIQVDLREKNAKTNYEKALAEKILPALFAAIDSPVYAEADRMLNGNSKAWGFDRLGGAIGSVGIRTFNMDHVVNRDGYFGYQNADILLDLQLDGKQHRLQLSFDQKRTDFNKLTLIKIPDEMEFIPYDELKK